jgi:hypothetical protein
MADPRKKLMLEDQIDMANLVPHNLKREGDGPIIADREMALLRMRDGTF